MIVVLCGGNTERFVSAKSGDCISQALTELNIEHKILDPENCNIEQELISLKPEKVINVLFGGWGENGGAQKLLEKLHIPHNGTNWRAAHIFMHKHMTLKYAKQLNITHPTGMLLSKDEYANHNSFPHVIKPTDGGSTLDMYKVNNTKEQAEVLKNWQNTTKQLVEEFVKGLEYTLAIYENEIFGGINIEFPGDMFDYFIKYDTKSPVKHTLEYPKFKQAYDQAKENGLKLYKELGCTGFVRMDFIIDTQTQTPYLLEANNNPGMTHESLVPDIAKIYHNLNYTQLVEMILKNSTIPILSEEMQKKLAKIIEQTE